MKCQQRLLYSREPACRKVEILSRTFIRFQIIFLAFRFFLLLYLLVPTYTTFIRAPFYQNFHSNISFDNPLLFIVNPLLFTVHWCPYYRSSYTCRQPATGYTALLSTALWVQPCPTTTFSSFSSVCRPTSSPFPFARRPTALLVLNPTSHQHNIHTSKQTSFCIHNFHGTFTALTNSSFFTHRHTASLWGYPTQSRSHPPCKPPHLHPQYSLHAHP